MTKTILFLIFFVIQQCNSQVPKECLTSPTATILREKALITHLIGQINELNLAHSSKLQNRHSSTFHHVMRPIASNFTYNDHLYLIFNEPTYDVSMAYGICATYAGYLVQLDNENEMDRVQEHLLKTNIECIHIGITDPLMNDKWIYPMTRTQAFTKFDDEQTEKYSCAMLKKDDGFEEMIKTTCFTRCHFVCEVPLPDE